MLIAGLTRSDIRVWNPLVIVLAVGMTTAILAVFAAVASRMQRPEPREPVRELIRRGESDRLEFKSTARWNLHTAARDERMEMVIAKAVAGFLNTDGGTLLIGVDDSGTVLGLVNDFSTVRGADADRFELWLRDFLTTTLGQNAAATPRHRLHPGDGRRRGDVRLPGDLPGVAASGVRPPAEGQHEPGTLGADRQFDPPAEGGRGRRLRDAPLAVGDRADGVRATAGGGTGFRRGIAGLRVRSAPRLRQGGS